MADEFEDRLSVYDSIGEKFQMNSDPLKKFDNKFKELEIDPISIYCDQVIMKKDNVEKVNTTKVSIIESWSEHMSDFDRHPTCPNLTHVASYMNKEMSKRNKVDTTLSKMRELSSMFEYWSEHPKMPHGTGEARDFNPVRSVLELKRDDILAKREDDKKPPHQISIEELSHKIRQIKNILQRAFVVCQLKHGSRAGQTSNIQLKDIQLNHNGLKELYPTIGTHTRFNNIDDDVIYYAPFQERKGGKSKRPIVMPVDQELKRILIRYLQQRPPVNKKWMFINPVSCEKIRTEYANRKFWKTAFHPEYDETEMYRPVTSHYARHRFNTYWGTEIDIKSEHLKYMRGDKKKELATNSSDAMHAYIHAYYPDIKDIYLDKIYKFNI